jgi:hypothetical protein
MAPGPTIYGKLPRYRDPGGTMRARLRILIILALFVTPAELRAQQAAPAAPVGGCADAADPSWTAQEKFVWTHFCKGEVANFNRDPAYGGNIDPRTAPLPENRILRSSFIATLFIEEKYLNEIKRHGLRVNGARFAEPLELHLTLTGQLWLDRCQFDKGADLAWLRSTQPIGFNNSTIRGGLTLFEARIAADLQMVDTRIGGADLSGARIEGNLDFSGSHVTGPLVMNGIHVQGQMSLGNAKVNGRLDMFNAQLGGDLPMQGAEFFGPVNLRSTQVAGQLNWNNATFHKDVDLSGARVGGELQLSSAKWLNRAMLTARYAKIGVIPGLSDAWPDRLNVFGLTYDGLAETAGDFRPWFERQETHARQPYEQLAGVLQARGEIERATEVRVAGRDRERSEQPRHIYAWLTLLKYLIGYGYYPYYSLAWIAGFVLLGALVLRVSGEGTRNHMPIGLSYSFDMLLPVVRLRDAHYQIDLQGRPRYYFYCHKLMGWVLASFLVAGLSGLTK